MKTVVMGIAGLVFAAMPAAAQAPTIEVQNAWSRAAPAAGTGVVFLNITDHGAPDRLVGVASPVAEQAALHETTQDNGVMRMRPVAELRVETGKTVSLAPGGYHIMLMHLKQALKEGDQVPVVLTFEKAGAVAVSAAVSKVGGGMPHAGQEHKTGG
jgi:copper(I)-binding protein